LLFVDLPGEVVYKAAEVVLQADHVVTVRLRKCVAETWPTVAVAGGGVAFPALPAGPELTARREAATVEWLAWQNEARPPPAPCTPPRPPLNRCR